MLHTQQYSRYYTTILYLAPTSNPKLSLPKLSPLIPLSASQILKLAGMATDLNNNTYFAFKYGSLSSSCIWKYLLTCPESAAAEHRRVSQPSAPLHQNQFLWEQEQLYSDNLQHPTSPNIFIHTPSRSSNERMEIFSRSSGQSSPS